MADEKPAAEGLIKNCPACKKVLKKARRYYRNGNYYCNKNCYKKATEKAAEKTEDAKE